MHRDVATELSVLESALSSIGAPEEMIWEAQRVRRLIEQEVGRVEVGNAVAQLRHWVAALDLAYYPRWKAEVQVIAIRALDKLDELAGLRRAAA